MIPRLLIETYESKSRRQSSEAAQLGEKRSQNRDRRGIQRWGGSSVRAGKTKRRKNPRRRQGQLSEEGQPFFKKKKRKRKSKIFWADREKKLFDKIII